VLSTSGGQGQRKAFVEPSLDQRGRLDAGQPGGKKAPSSKQLVWKGSGLGHDKLPGSTRLQLAVDPISSHAPSPARRPPPGWPHRFDALGSSTASALKANGRG